LGGLFGDTATDEENPFGGIHSGEAAPHRLGRQASIVWIVVFGVYLKANFGGIGPSCLPQSLRRLPAPLYYSKVEWRIGLVIHN
jgi:hypothetical protein